MTERRTTLQDAFHAKTANPDNMVILVSAPNASRIIVSEKPETPIGKQKQLLGTEYHR